MRKKCADALQRRTSGHDRSILRLAMKATTHSAAILALVLAAGCATPIFDIARAQPTGGGPGSASPPLTPAPEPGPTPRVLSKLTRPF